LFVIAVLAFILGIYLQALYTLPSLPCAILLFCLTALTPFLLPRKHLAAPLLILACFAMAGMLRLGMASPESKDVTIDEGKSVYEGLVVQASPNTKVIRLSYPAGTSGLKVVFRSSDSLIINDRVRVYGEIREINLTFNNPSLTPWKWLKRLEGVSYELRGITISSLRGRDPIQATRDRIRKRIETSGAMHPHVIKALTIGDTTGLDEQTKTLFLRTGTSHILAISGSNIGIITAFFFFLARIALRRCSTRLRLRGDDTRYASLLSIPFAIVFMLIAGSSIPTIRATIMITVFMLALFFERGRNVINTIALSALIILLVYPHSIFMPTFQLTFMSVLFLVIATQRFYTVIHARNRPVKWVLSSILMTVAATIGTLPIVIYHFYGMNPLSVIHNLIAVPLMCVIALPISLLGIILPYGELLLRVAGRVLDLNMHLLEYLNFGYIYPIIRPDLMEIALYFCLILSIIYIGRKPVLLFFLIIVLPVSGIQGYLSYKDRFHDGLVVNFLDVGLGDALLLEGPGGTRILIDGGGYYRGDYDIGKSIITPILLSKKIRTLDYVINTHPHGDHIGGLPYILQHFDVRTFVSGGYYAQEGRFMDLLQIARNKGIHFDQWNSGHELTLKKGLRISVLNPDPDFAADDLNNASLVLKVAYKNNSFLLTGDIDLDIEEKLVLERRELRSNILKVPHHGSKNSNSLVFVRSVMPNLAVLSVGSGVKGLPGRETLRTYERLRIPLLRTDRHGFIQVRTDGSRITYRTFRK
jgi:competence protein ComEC